MVWFALILVLGLAQSALALDITPSDSFASGNEGPANPAVIAAAEAACGCVLNSQYKQDVGGGESGPLAASYSTTFANSPNDPEEFTITYEGGPIVSPIQWLIVKDGNSTPVWYLFNLTDLGWDGMDTVSGTDFWPSNGAVSHVELFSSDEGQQVPEPASLILLGSGMLALGLIRRRYRQ